MAKLYQKINGVAVPLSGGTAVIDNLTSTATDKALSANQGRILKQMIDSIDGGGSVIRVTFEEECAGDTVTFAMSGMTTITKTVPSESPYMIEVATTELGILTVTDVTQSIIKTININTYSLYTLYIALAGFEQWLEAGGITTQYASLAEVLADEPTVRTLMTKQDAVDYLVLWLPMDNASLTTIINDNYCAKWINLRDYALDTLYANATIKTAMDTADKYFYGEWVERDGVWQPKGNVPIMTANNAPYGVASADGENASHSAYMAFDDNNTSYWSKSGVGKIIYTFTNPMCVKMFDYMGYDTDNTAKNYRVLGSNDGTTWTPITSGTLQNVGTLQHIKVSNDTYYLKIALDIVDMYGQTTNANAKTLQFYGRELKVSVPTMTSNTEPWGEVIASGNTGALYPYKAFINDNTNFWAKDNDKTAWVGYDFGTPVICKFFRFNPLSSTTTYDYTYKLQGSNDKAEWNDITNVENFSTSASVKYHGENSANVVCTDFISDTPYRYLRYKQESTSGQNTNGGAMQFYGLDYSEHTERHWIYDHGVEVEEIGTYVTGGSVVEKRSNEVYISHANATSIYANTQATNIHDLSTYNLMRCVVGDELVSGNPNAMGIGIGSTLTTTVIDLAFNWIFDTSNVPNNLSVDISNVNEGYPKIVCAGNGVSKGTYTEWWLE